MPIVDCPPDFFSPPSRLDLAWIEARMLWPDQADRQAETWRTAFVEAVREHMAAGLPIDIDPLALLSIAAEATPLGKLREAAAQPFRHGCAAGWLLLETVWRAETGRRTRLTSVKATIAKALKLSTSTIDNTAWATYRAVAHYYAAFLARARDGALAFPCAVAGLPHFLARAEHLRQMAETVIPPHRAAPLLRPGQALILRPPFPLPPSDLRFDSSKRN